jgi:hypothetical protein
MKVIAALAVVALFACAFSTTVNAQSQPKCILKSNLPPGVFGQWCAYPGTQKCFDYTARAPGVCTQFGAGDSCDCIAPPKRSTSHRRHHTK